MRSLCCMDTKQPL